MRLGIVSNNCDVLIISFLKSCILVNFYALKYFKIVVTVILVNYELLINQTSICVFRLAFLLACIFIHFSSLAQKYSNEFLSIPVGARARVWVVHRLEVSVMQTRVWNPAGLTQLPLDLQVAAMHNEWFASIGRHDLQGIGPIEKESKYLGFTFIRFLVSITFPIRSHYMKKRWLDQLFECNNLQCS